MSIVKMKRVRLIALENDKEALLSGLLHGGCVEVNEPILGEEEQAALLRRSPSALAEAKGRQSELKLAIETLNRYAPQKGGGLTAPRDRLAAGELLRDAALEATLCNKLRIAMRAHDSPPEQFIRLGL